MDLTQARSFLFPVRSGPLRMHPAHPVRHPVPVHRAVSMFLPQLRGARLPCTPRLASPEPRVVLGAQRMLTQGAWWEGGAEAGGGERGYIPHTRAFSATFPGLPPCAGECGGGLRARRVRASAHTWTPRGRVQGWQSRLSPGR